MDLVADLCTKLDLMPCLDSFLRFVFCCQTLDVVFDFFFLINWKMRNVVSSSLACYLEENGKLD